jgi:hypothetical protein
VCWQCSQHVCSAFHGDANDVGQAQKLLLLLLRMS